MGSDISLTFWAIVATGAIVAHVAALMSARWINLLFLAAAGFFVLSPMSGAPEFLFVVPAKWGRLYMTLVIIALGIFVYRSYRLRPTAIVFLVFAGLYALAGAWSSAPLEALKYKGLYFLLVLAGLLLGNSIRDFADLRVGIRLLGLACATFVAFIMIEFVRNPSAISHVGRLATWGMNSNRIGQTAAPMLVVCTYMALSDPVKAWKIFAYCVCTLLGVLIIYTASRGAAGEAAIGCFVVGLPLMRRPLLWALLAAVAVATAFLAWAMIDIDATERFFEISLATRAAPWMEAIYQMQQSPVFGTGWVYHIEGGTESTENMHSIFMQALVETGFIGLALLILAILAVLFKCYVSWRYMRAIDHQIAAIFLPIGIIVAVVIHGLFESASITGGMIGAMLLPAGIALLDRIPRLAAAELEQYRARDAADDAAREPDALDDFGPLPSPSF